MYLSESAVEAMFTKGLQNHSAPEFSIQLIGREEIDQNRYQVGDQG